MAMGAADVVPGVSGGTIAFISGIYEELLSSLKSVNIDAIRLLLNGKFKEFWLYINGSFLISLFIGIGISLISLVKLIHFLLDNHPILIWSFFFGLIVASAYVVGKSIKQVNAFVISAGLLGSFFGFFITVATPAETPNESWFIFISGMIAICAMILPGISGSFILLLLKKYEYITGALKDLNILVIVTFGAGAVVGLLSFSHVLTWLLKKYHNTTIAFLTGLMIGSLNVVWPWKKVIETRINSKGIEEAFRYESVSPFNFEGTSQLELAVGLAIIGFFVILILDKLGSKKTIGE